MVTQKQIDNRSFILDQAEKLLFSIGRDAVTIRAVSDAAAVQAPTIYRLFGDKRGLLDAVAERGFLRYMDDDQGYIKQTNLIDELRNGWNFHVKFGVNNPELYALMYDESHYPNLSPAAKIAHKGFEELIRQVAEAGYLKVSQEQAIFMAFASAAGTVRSLFALPNPVNIEEYCENIRESMIADVAVQPSTITSSLVANAATTLRANLDKIENLSASERELFKEWLNRIK